NVFASLSMPALVRLSATTTATRLLTIFASCPGRNWALVVMPCLHPHRQAWAVLVVSVFAFMGYRIPCLTWDFLASNSIQMYENISAQSLRSSGVSVRPGAAARET